MEIKKDSKNIREKHRQHLIQHVNNHYFLKYHKKSQKRDGYWETGCWLGKEPTGRLFTIRLNNPFSMSENLTQLANDMWDYLFTPQGEQKGTRGTNHDK